MLSMQSSTSTLRRAANIARMICIFILLLFSANISHAFAEDVRIPPSFPVPDYVTSLISVASKEVGYTEGPHGYTKYGEWAGDPYAQWCAEFLCWCVNEVDQELGTNLLTNVYPMYSSSNTGRAFFIQKGRYIVRWGNLDVWGYQWLKGEDHFLTTGSYIPQPGDWIFFTWTSDLDTDHVSMVEYCTMNTETGEVTIHVIEGNTPSSVKRTTYPLTYTRILGFGTVHDAADWTMRSGNQGEKVRQLQEKLIYLGYLPDGADDGRYGSGTASALTRFQQTVGLKAHGIANISTQLALNAAYEQALNLDPTTWQVEDALDEDSFSDFSFSDFSFSDFPSDDFGSTVSVGSDHEDELSLDEEDEFTDLRLDPGSIAEGDLPPEWVNHQ